MYCATSFVLFHCGSLMILQFSDLPRKQTSNKFTLGGNCSCFLWEQSSSLTHLLYSPWKGQAILKGSWSPWSGDLDFTSQISNRWRNCIPWPLACWSWIEFERPCFTILLLEGNYCLGGNTFCVLKAIPNELLGHCFYIRD